MRKMILITFLMCISSFVAQPANSSVITPSEKVIFPKEVMYDKISSLKLNQLRQLAGRKLTLKEKIGFLLLKHRLKQRTNDEKMPGNTAFLLALTGLGLLVAGLFIPYVIIGSIVASILAVALGSSAYKQNRADKKAHSAKIIGLLTLGVIALFALLAIVLIATWASWL